MPAGLTDHGHRSQAKVSDDMHTAALICQSSLLWTHADAVRCDVQQQSHVKEIAPWSKDLAVQVVSNKSEERKPERHVASILLQHTNAMLEVMCVCGCCWHGRTEAMFLEYAQTTRQGDDLVSVPGRKGLLADCVSSALTSPWATSSSCVVWSHLLL